MTTHAIDHIEPVTPASPGAPAITAGSGRGPAPIPATPTPIEAPSAAAAKPRQNPIPLTIAVVIVLALGSLGARQWSFGRTHVGTDNAQIQGDIIPVLDLETNGDLGRRHLIRWTWAWLNQVRRATIEEGIWLSLRKSAPARPDVRIVAPKGAVLGA